jgi:hypothetical protein
MKKYYEKLKSYFVKKQPVEPEVLEEECPLVPDFEISYPEYERVVIHQVRGENPPGYVKVVLVKKDAEGNHVHNSAKEVSIKITHKMRPTVNRVLLGKESEADMDLFRELVLGDEAADY